jgi:hypothetical protein
MQEDSSHPLFRRACMASETRTTYHERRWRVLGGEQAEGRRGSNAVGIRVHESGTWRHRELVLRLREPRETWSDTVKPSEGVQRRRSTAGTHCLHITCQLAHGRDHLISPWVGCMMSLRSHVEHRAIVVVVVAAYDRRSPVQATCCNLWCGLVKRARRTYI